jgi:oxalate decarboxylase/phosphoglucose isomerase-like protein (cupin superfamily)
MSDIVPAGEGHLLSARGNMLAFKAVAAQTGGDFSLMDGELTGSAGDFLLVPRGAGHTFGNTGDSPARLLVLHAPAMDAYFEELHRLWASAEPPAPEVELELMGRYGMEVL